jgi:hypothetical protein
MLNRVSFTYYNAMTRKDKVGWRLAMITEFESAESKNILRIVNIFSFPLVKHLVCTQNEDGRCRALTMAKGCIRSPGKYSQANFGTVLNDTTFRMIIVFQLFYELFSCNFDVKTAFLNGAVEE